MYIEHPTRLGAYFAVSDSGKRGNLQTVLNISAACESYSDSSEDLKVEQHSPAAPTSAPSLCSDLKSGETVSSPLCLASSATGGLLAQKCSSLGWMLLDSTGH